MLASFALGAHIGNNVGDTGLSNLIIVFSHNLFGILLIGLFAIIFILGIYNIKNIFGRGATQ